MTSAKAEAGSLPCVVKLSSALAVKEITAKEYNDALHVADHTNVVRLGERGSHLRIR